MSQLRVRAFLLCSGLGLWCLGFSRRVLFQDAHNYHKKKLKSNLRGYKPDSPEFCRIERPFPGLVLVAQLMELLGDRMGPFIWHLPARKSGFKRIGPWASHRRSEKSKPQSWLPLSSLGFNVARTQHQVLCSVHGVSMSKSTCFRRIPV